MSEPVPFVRPAATDDADALAALLAAYLAERFPGHPGTPAAKLAADVLAPGSTHHVLLAERHGAAIGFVAWDAVYDLHWAQRGAQIADLFVRPGSRGQGVALALVAAVCARAAEMGATFLRGASYDRQSPTGRFYERIAVGHDSAECHCAGRAFRQMASLHGAPVRQMARSLPPVEWNYEA
ncbi:MAG TPA: GNAT family N-acetyltransferase [Longimicrobium sp.]|nr:GNAT family N-acetyltransferase [Longimicrobium sp.]